MKKTFSSFNVLSASRRQSVACNKDLLLTGRPMTTARPSGKMPEAHCEEHPVLRGVSELNSVAQQFEKVIGELQNLKA